MLAMQLGIVCVVLVGVAAVSLAQSDARARDTEGRRALAIAERLAVTAGVREAAASGGREYLGQATSVVESGRTFSSSTTVLLALGYPDTTKVYATPISRFDADRLFTFA